MLEKVNKIFSADEKYPPWPPYRQIRSQGNSNTTLQTELNILQQACGDMKNHP